MRETGIARYWDCARLGISETGTVKLRLREKCVKLGLVRLGLRETGTARKWDSETGTAVLRSPLGRLFWGSGRSRLAAVDSDAAGEMGVVSP